MLREHHSRQVVHQHHANWRHHKAVLTLNYPHLLNILDQPDHVKLMDSDIYRFQSNNDCPCFFLSSWKLRGSVKAVSSLFFGILGSPLRHPCYRVRWIPAFPCYSLSSLGSVGPLDPLDQLHLTRLWTFSWGCWFTLFSVRSQMTLWSMLILRVRFPDFR